jgi:hypothetical protein
VDLKTKAQIIVDFAYRFTDSDNEDFQDFLDYNDLGIPLAVAITNDLCEINDKGMKVFEETYTLLLVELKVPDIYKDYEELDEILEDSPIVDDEEE